MQSWHMKWWCPVLWASKFASLLIEGRFAGVPSPALGHSALPASLVSRLLDWHVPAEEDVESLRGCLGTSRVTREALCF